MRNGAVVGCFLVLGLLFTGVPRAEEIGEPAFLGVQLREEIERPEGGALVTHVVNGSPAEESGLREGDIVAEIDGEVIRGPLALTQRIHTLQPGDTVALTVIRDGEAQELEVELGRRSDRAGRAVVVPPVRVPPTTLWVEPAPAVEPDEMPDVDPSEILERLEVLDLSDSSRYFTQPYIAFGQKPRLGVQMVETTPELREHLGGSEEAGVLVSKILSGLPAQEAGLKVGDLIVAVDGEPVASSSDLIRALVDKVGATFGVEVIRDGRSRTFEVTIPEPETERPTGPRA